MMQSVEHMSLAQRSMLVQEIQGADEVAMTLVYDDRASQLREIVVEKRKKIHDLESKPVSVAVAVPVTTANSTLRYVSFPLVYPQKRVTSEEDPVENIHQWTRRILSELMSSKTRKIIFDAQELIESLLAAFSYEQTEVILSWSALDPKVACWLIDPDNPPVTFTQILATLPEVKQLDPLGHTDDQICSDLSLLGPVLFQLFHKLKAQGLWLLYSKLEMPLCPVLACMQQRCLKVDTDIMLQSGQWLQKKLKKLEKAAFEAAGHSFMINSHPQLRQILFEELKLDQKLPTKTKVARTAANQYKSTSEAVLSQLSSVHPLPGIILEYRQVQKVKSTYVDGLLSFVQDGMLYTHWDHTAAVTGRLTSTNPNLQAVPKQPLVLEGVRDSVIVGKEDNRPIEIYAREPFVTRDGWSFLAADFQQIELRLLAHLSRDSSLLAVFQNDDTTDIFVELTSQWLCKPVDQVTTSDREQTKRVVYSVMYGAGKERLSEYLKITAEDAKAIMTSFLGKFPNINIFNRKCIDQARQNGYQCTIFRRRRWFPHLNHRNAVLRAQAERQAVNFCVQGSAADLCKAAMIQTEHALAEKCELEARLLLQIHDELLLEVPDEEIEEVTELLRSIMESSEGLCGNMVQLRVPLRVSFSKGKTWGHLTSLSNYSKS